MGFLIFADTGNSGFKTPHHPWGECGNCIVVGTENHLTHKIAGFSSGCCSSSVDVVTRGTKFALIAGHHKFSGTSFPTAVISGAFTFIIPNIWTVDQWNTIHDVVKPIKAAMQCNAIITVILR